MGEDRGSGGRLVTLSFRRPTRARRAAAAAWCLSCLLGATAFPVAHAQSPAPSASSLVTDKDGRIRTQFVARDSVTLSAEIAARIASLPLREGDAFRAGQALVGFDCGLYQSQLRKAEAAADAASAVQVSNQRLADLHSIGKAELEQSQARLKEAQAEATGARLLVNRCTVTAPFAGRIARRRAAAFAYVTPGTPLLDIVETGRLELQMIVPSKWLAWLKPGAPLQVDVDELGRRVDAKVVRIGAQIDPVSQTVAVFGAIDGAGTPLLPGMSGWAVFPGRH